MNTDKKTKPKTKAAALALVPDYETPALNECAAHIEELHALIERNSRRFYDENIYHVVELGAWMNRVVEKLRGPCPSIGQGKPREADGSYKNEGIGPFLSTHPLLAQSQVKRATAYNYMAAARNAGVKRPEEVGALREQKALHGKKPTELYRLATPAEKTPKPAPAPLPEGESPIVRECIRDLFRCLQQIRDWRNATTPEQFEAVCERLKSTLEFLSDANWDMVNGPGDYRPEGQHGEMRT